MRSGTTAVGTTFRATLSVIPPGKHVASVSGGARALSGRHGVELACTDRAGVHWLRSAHGTLTEIKEPPVEYYDLEVPTTGAYREIERGTPQNQGNANGMPWLSSSDKILSSPLAGYFETRYTPPFAV